MTKSQFIFDSERSITALSPTKSISISGDDAGYSFSPVSFLVGLLLVADNHDLNVMTDRRKDGDIQKTYAMHLQ